MKRITILLAVVVLFVLGGSAAMAKGGNGGGGQGKGGNGKGGGGKGNKEAKQVQERSQQQQKKQQGKANAGGDQVKAQERKGRQQGKAANEKVEKGKAKAAKEAGAAEEKVKKQKGKANAGKGRGKGKGQQGLSRAKQIEHESAKHGTRKARLAEMKKVAAGKGDDKAVARIQKLIDKEQGRYDRKNKKMTERGSQDAADDADSDEE